MNVNIELPLLQQLPAPIFVFFAFLSVAMIVAGRKLLWLYLASVVFLVVYLVLQEGQLPGLNETAIVLIALGSGLVVGAIAFFLRTVTLVMAALVLGINMATLFGRMLNVSGQNAEATQGVVSIVLGLASVAAALRYRDDALVVLSVLVGVGLFTQEVLRMNTNAPLTAIVWLALCLFGVIVQYAFLQREQRAQSAKSRTAPAAGPLPISDLSR